MFLKTVAACAAGIALVAPGAFSQTPASGFATSPLPNPGGLVRTLSDGQFVTWDGRFVRLFEPAGENSLLLHDFSTANFTGAMALAPDESFVVVGESTNGDLFRVELPSGGATYLTTLPINYHAAFSPDGWLGVSAAATSFQQSDVYRVDATSGATTIQVEIPGASGPLDFDFFGNLLLATSSNQFPAPPGSSEVLRFAKSDLDSLPAMQSLGELDAQVVATGFDGAYSLVADASSFRVFLAENDFGTGSNRVYEVLSSQADSTVLYEGASFTTNGIEQFVPGTDGAVFQGFQPSFGGALLLTSTDFFSFDDRLALHPQRPALSLSGPGTIGVGPFDLEQTGGLAGGVNLLLYGPANLLGPELPVPGFTPPLFLGLDVPSVTLFPYQLVSSGAGALSVPLYNVSGQVGMIAIQVLALDELGSALATSTIAVL